jgi:hypothetical protein
MAEPCLREHVAPTLAAFDTSTCDDAIMPVATPYCLQLMYVSATNAAPHEHVDSTVARHAAIVVVFVELANVFVRMRKRVQLLS